jgi:hypothetical protein
MRLRAVFSSWSPRGGSGAPVRESTFASLLRPRENMPVFSDFSLFNDVGVWLTTVCRGMSRVWLSMFSPVPLSGWKPWLERRLDRR